MKEKVLKKAALVFLVAKGKVCLPIKKWKIGAGFRNGYGGGIKSDETADDCAIRELLEEAGVKTWVVNLKPIALLLCHNCTEKGVEFTCVVGVFTTNFWLGKPKETKEMGPPIWYPVKNLARIKNQFMLGDREWLPRLFQDGKPLVVEMWYGPRQASLERPTVIKEVEILPEE